MCILTYMARANVYIRKENEASWSSINHKSNWVNEMLRSQREAGSRFGAPFRSDTLELKKAEVIPVDTTKYPNRAEDKIAIMDDPKDWVKPCKHGADPRFCKLAKNGKVCK